MKVVFFSSTGSMVGGAAICLKEILLYCKRIDIEPFVILRDHGNMEGFLTDNSIRYSVVKSFDWLRPKKDHGGIKNEVKWRIKKFLNMFAEKRVYRVLKKERPDIYHINVIYNACGAKSAKKLGIPVIWHLREFVEIDDNTPYFRNAKKAYDLISQSEYIICVSDCIKEFYSKFVSETKLIRIYDGIKQPKHYEKKNLEGKIIMTLSGSAKVKGHEDLIEAASLIKNQGYDSFLIKIVGQFYDENYLKHLNHRVHALGLDENVVFQGFQKNMEKVWRETHIAIVCSRFESFGLSVVEAMARAIPAICAKTTGSYEVTDKGDYCELYEIGNHKELALKLLKIIQNYNDYSEKAYRNAPVIADKYSIRKSCEDLIEVFRNCR